MEQRSEEFKKISPTGKLPALSDTLESGDTFNLIESHAIMRYLIERFNKFSLYPKEDLQLRATVDSYLDWHHTNTRKCASYIFNKYFAASLGLKYDPLIDSNLTDIESSFRFI